MKEGYCPTCGGDDIEYMDIELEGESMGRNVQCRSCKTKFTEWYALVYEETVKH